MPEITHVVDPVTGRLKYVDANQVDVPRDGMTGLAGDVFNNILFDNREDEVSIARLEKLHEDVIVFSGVADGDWAAGTGTDNSAAMTAALDAAFASSSPHTSIIVPPGTYSLGTTRFYYPATKEITIKGIGDARLFGNNTARIFSFDGELSSLGLHDVMLLSGDHLRTAVTGTDGRTYYQGVSTLQFTADHGATIGEPVYLYGTEVYVSDFGYFTCHMSRVKEIPTSSSLVMEHETFFDFFDGDAVWMARYGGPIHLENLKLKNLHTADSCQLVTLYRCPGSSVKDCEFRLISNPAGTSDIINLSDSIGFTSDDCKYHECRYGINANRIRDLSANRNEVYDSRHFVSWGTASYNARIDGVVGTGNTSIVDGHIGFEYHARNISDLRAINLANAVLNCRNIGYSLVNVEWQADTVGTLGFIMDVGQLISKYHDLHRKHQIQIKNVKMLTPSFNTFSLGNAGRVSIDGLTFAGYTDFRIGTGSSYGVDDWDVRNVTGTYIDRYYKAEHTRERLPRHWQDATYTEYTGTAVGPGGAANEIEIVDGVIPGNADPVGYLCEITGGAGAGQTPLRIIGWDGDADTAVVSGDFSPVIDGTSVYRISRYDLDARDMTLWSEAYRQNRLAGHVFGGVSSVGDIDGRSRRMRINMMAEQDFGSPNAGPNRFEAINIVFHVWRLNINQPVNERWEYLISHKSLAAPAVTATLERHVGSYHATNDYSFALSDVQIPGTFDGWVEFTMDFGADLDSTGLALWFEAVSRGVAI